MLMQATKATEKELLTNNKLLHLKASRKLLLANHTKNIDVLIDRSSRTNKEFVAHYKKEAKSAKVDAVVNAFDGDIRSYFNICDMY